MSSQNVDMAAASLQNQTSFSSADPVPLTEDQIKEILEEIPKPPGVGKSAINLAHKHTVDRVRAVLENIKLRPFPEAFKEFKEDIIRTIYESFIEPGSAVGVTAGVSLGGPITQLSLNSFHFAGAQSGVALAFQKVRDFLTGSKMNRTPQMKIYLKVPFVGNDLHEMLHIGTFESIMALRPEFEQTTVQDVVVDSHILTRDEAVAAGVLDMINIHARLRPERFVDAATRYPLTHVVQLQLNTYRMYTHKITMSMLCQAIEGPSNPPDALTCVWRSQFDGRMYILVDETRDYGQKAVSQDTAILMFLNRVVIRKFGQLKISGIAGIISIVPQEVRVINGIYRVKASTQTKGVHYVYTNNRKTRWDGISLADIRLLLTAAGFKVQPITPQHKQGLYLTVEGFEGDLMSELERRVEAAIQKSVVDRTPEEARLVSAATFHYILTNGTNMEEIVWRDDIDLFRTISNHPHEVFEMLGIDAARIFLIFRFIQTLEDFSSYINTRHISLVFDLLCNLGIINSLSFVGINRRRIGPLAMASFERSMDVFANASIFGEREAITGVSPAIYVGQRSKRVGTGSIELEEDITAVPQDRPTIPTADEDTYIGDEMIDEVVFEGTDLADMIENEDIRQTRAMAAVSAPGQVDKERIKPVTRITSQPQPATDSIVPSGAPAKTTSPILLNALKKVTVGTGLVIEESSLEVADKGEDLADITSLEDISDLSLQDEIPSRYQPAPPSANVDMLSSLTSVSTQGIEVADTAQVPAPDKIQTATSLSTPRYVPEALPVSTVKPEVRLPPAPTSDAPIAETRTLSPGSFLDLLPDLSDVTIPTSSQGNVQGISFDEYSKAISSYLSSIQS